MENEKDTGQEDPGYVRWLTQDCKIEGQVTPGFEKACGAYAEDKRALDELERAMEHLKDTSQRALIRYMLSRGDCRILSVGVIIGSGRALYPKNKVTVIFSQVANSSELSNIVLTFNF